MKRAALLSVLVAIVLCADASAATTADLQRASRISSRVHPAGPVPTYRIGGLHPENTRRGSVADADFRGCQIPGRSRFGAGRCEVRFEKVWVEAMSFAVVCSAFIHEEGHLDGWWVPGQPDDGVHAADARSNMAGELVHHPACGVSDKRRMEIRDHIANLREYAGELRELRDHSTSRARRQSITRRIMRLRVRVVRYRAMLVVPNA